MTEQACPGCQQRDGVIAALETQVGALTAQVQDLQAKLRNLETRLGTNASNSSLPPSANPLAAPKPVTKKPSGLKPGGQPGHPPHLRVRLPRQRLQRIIPLLPKTCQNCFTPLPQEAAPDDPAPTWHQVAELPKIAARVIEYQGHARRCPRCDTLTWAQIPERIRGRSIGPRLAAVMSLLSGRHHVSRRGVEEIVETVFDVPVALGTVCNLEEEMSQALQSAHAEAVQAVREAAVKNVDETGWKQAGRKRWLWAAATTRVAAFGIVVSRGAAGLTTLLGETIQGILCSDRWSVYTRVPAHQRQVCWAHLKRDFQKCVDRGGASLAIGEGGLRVVKKLFRRWYAFRGGGLDRAGLERKMVVVRRELQALLESGRGCADPPTARFCRNLLGVEEALWTFSRVEGVEPTNNHIERQERPAVLWRKNSFGSWSASGCQFVERLLTVVQTLRLQQRPVLDYLHQALVAHRKGLPAPKLLLSE